MGGKLIPETVRRRSHADFHGIYIVHSLLPDHEKYDKNHSYIFCVRSHTKLSMLPNLKVSHGIDISILEFNGKSP